jgi:pimeloyl-ACP methyl ester carboxylesterase
MSERVVPANGIQIWTEDFGNQPDPKVLLIMGATAQAIMWPDEFCHNLASARLHVVRYDHRDTGKSTCFDFSTDPYTIDDHVADAIGILDAYEVGAAHIVGASMGGRIAYRLAMDFAERVSTLTLIMTRAPEASGSVIREGSPQWEQQQRINDAVALHAAPAKDEQERIERGVELARALAGPDQPFDEQVARDLQGKVLARARNLGASRNHFLQGPGRERTNNDLKGITAPTLVIHGTADPSFSEGEALANIIPSARFLPIEGVGHYFGPPVPPEILPAVLDHVKWTPVGWLE